MIRKNQKYNPSASVAATVAAGMILLLAGCSETPEPVELVGFPLPVEIETARLAGEVETRASDVKDLKQGAIGLFRTTDNGYDAIDNTPYSYTDGKWTSGDSKDNTKTIFVDHRNATLYGYYPYAATPDASGTVFNLSLKRFADADALFYTGDMTNITNRNTSLEMQLKPAYSRLTFRLKNHNLPNCVISKMTIEPTTGTFITDGTIDIHAVTPAVVKGSKTASEYVFPFKTAAAGADAATIAAADTITTTGIATGKSDETMDMLWIPQSLSGIKITIVLHFNGEDADTTPLLNNALSVTIPSAKLAELQQGTQHIIPLLVKGTTVTVNNTTNLLPVLVPGDEIDPFEEDKLTSFTLPPVEVSEGLYVATGNVYRYFDEGLQADWYTFSSKSGNMYGASATRTAAFTQAEVQNKEGDPCYQVGPNWRTPKGHELEAIANAVAGNYTSLTDVTSANGWYVGVANKEKGVFFPTGSYLSSDGGYLSVTSGGVTYNPTVASSTTKYTVRCISDTKYGTN